MKGHACLCRALKWPRAVPKAHPSSTKSLKVRKVKPVALLVPRQRRTLASRALGQSQTVTRVFFSNARAPADLAREIPAILGVTGVDMIWPEENTDDEDSSEERTFPCHTRSTLQARQARQRVRRYIDKIRAGLSPDDLKKHLCALEELSAWGQLHKNTAEASSSWPTATIWHSSRTTPFTAHFSPL